jgi:hypothetical protein
MNINFVSTAAGLLSAKARTERVINAIFGRMPTKSGRRIVGMQATLNEVKNHLPMTAPTMKDTSRKVSDWSRINCTSSPNPAGAPGIFALTEVNANSAAIGITNNSFTTVSSHNIEAMVIHKNAILVIPGKMANFAQDKKQSSPGHNLNRRRTVCNYDEHHKYSHCK